MDDDFLNPSPEEVAATLAEIEAKNKQALEDLHNWCSILSSRCFSLVGDGYGMSELFLYEGCVLVGWEGKDGLFLYELAESVLEQAKAPVND